jgi:glycosyltransferase involved in cell wall biosynthesis
MGKIKIVELIGSLCARGGAETFFYSLVNEISKREDVELHVIILHENIHNSFSSLFSNENIKVHVLSKKKGIDISCALKFKKIIKQINPDIINGHNHYILTYLLAFGRKRMKFNLVHTAHSIAENTDKLSLFLSKKQRLNIIGISDLVSARNKIFFKNSRIKTIYNGIPLVDVKRNTCNQKKYDFICVAGFRIEKNHKLLIDAFEEYINTYGESSLCLVGDGILKKEIENYVINKKLTNNVVFTGSQDNVYTYLLQSKVFVLSSVYEGNPISILEAMNAGIAIVSTDVGGIRDVVENDISGYLCESNNMKLLSDNMHKAIINHETLGANNLKLISKYDIKNTASDYIDFFIELCEERK